MLGRGYRMWNYRSCLTAGGQNRKETLGFCPPEDCVGIMKADCLTSKYIVIKTIRFSMENMRFLLEKNPNIKIIHLLRDPRATIRSEIFMGVGRWQDIVNVSRTLCGRIMEDIEMFKIFQKDFPNRILRIRYEDLSRYPIDTSKLMYSFAGMEYTDNVRQYVHDRMIKYPNTSSVDDVTWKGNSTDRMDKWRLLVRWEFVKIIDIYCQQVYGDVGYMMAASADTLRDLSWSFTVD